MKGSNKINAFKSGFLSIFIQVLRGITMTSILRPLMEKKKTLHVTVVIAYQNIHNENSSLTLEAVLISGWPRRKFEGVIKYIPPFHTNLKLAKFRFADRNTDINGYEMDGSSTENANLQEEITNEIRKYCHTYRTGAKAGI